MHPLRAKRPTPISVALHALLVSARRCGPLAGAEVALAGRADTDDERRVHEESRAQADPEHAVAPLAQRSQVFSRLRRTRRLQHDLVSVHLARQP